MIDGIYEKIITKNFVAFIYEDGSFEISHRPGTWAIGDLSKNGIFVLREDAGEYFELNQKILTMLLSR